MSSFVFVVILAVWAVYLVQHWVRRRDHLATARSVDRFSEAMRVLERRRSLPVPDAGARPRSYAASPLRPARPGRPEVVVKQSRGGAHGATAVAPSQGHRRSRWVARLRASSLLAGSLAMVALVGLGMAGVLPRWSALVGVGVCALSVALVRWSVARQHAARRPARASSPQRRPGAASAPARAARRVHHPAATSATSAPSRVTRRVHQPAASVGRPAREGHEFSAQSVAVTLRTAPRRDAAREIAPAAEAGPELYDIHAVEASLADDTSTGLPAGRAAEPVAAGVAAQAPAEGTWHPVPVPPPTYTLKAKAYRPVPSSSVTLPADGTEMALEEEFEELPRIDRVG